LAELVAVPPESLERAEQAPRRARRKDARPGELLAAALDLFVERGFAATRAEDVAARAGVSKGTLFLYFPSKTELFKAVVRDSIVGRLREFAREVAEFQGPTPELVEHAMWMWWEQVGSTKAGGISKLMMAEAGNFPELAQFYLSEVIQPGTNLIASIVQRGIARGEFRNVDVMLTTQAFVAFMMHLINWKHSFGSIPACGYDVDPAAYVKHCAELVNNGLKPHASAMLNTTQLKK
jgi:TetR/AcrR family transcriptional regulator